MANPGTLQYRYCDPTNGDDNADGALLTPWKTFRHAVEPGRLAPGTTLILGAGRYYELDQWIQDPSINTDASVVWAHLRGTEQAPVTVCASGADKAVLDFSWNTPVLSFDGTFTLTSQPLRVPLGWTKLRVGGFFGRRKLRWRLLPYDRLEDFESTEHRAGRAAGETQYLGPGVYVEDLGAISSLERNVRIRVRIEPPALDAVGADATFEPILELAELAISLTIVKTMGTGTALWSFGAASNYGMIRHTTFRGLQLFNGCGLGFRSNLQAVRFEDVDFVFPGEGCRIDGESYDVSFVGCSFTGMLPPWISWADAKQPRLDSSALVTAGAMQTRGITFGKSPHHVNVVQCTFRELFDGLYVETPASHVTVKDSRFQTIRDDAIQIAVGATEVEVADNVIVDAHSAVTSQGGGTHRIERWKRLHPSQPHSPPAAACRSRQSELRRPHTVELDSRVGPNLAQDNQPILNS